MKVKTRVLKSISKIKDCDSTYQLIAVNKDEYMKYVMEMKEIDPEAEIDSFEKWSKDVNAKNSYHHECLKEYLFATRYDSAGLRKAIVINHIDQKIKGENTISDFDIITSNTGKMKRLEKGPIPPSKLFSKNEVRKYLLVLRNINYLSSIKRFITCLDQTTTMEQWYKKADYNSQKVYQETKDMDIDGILDLIREGVK